MTPLKNIFDFYITSSTHVALAVVSLAVVTSLHFGFPLDYGLLGFVFFGGVTGYNFVKYAGIARLHHRSLARNLRLIQLFSFFCFIALCYFATVVNPEILFIAGILGLFTALYALPILKGKKNLREVAGLKVFLIAFIWAGVTVLFPVVEAEKSLEQGVIVEFFQRFLFVLILILPFEIRDLKYDRAQLQTLPQRWGVRRVKIIGYVLIGLWVGLEFIKDHASETSIIAILLAASFTGLSIVRTKEDQSRYFASFWIEGIPILWMLMLIFVGYF